MSQEIVIAKEIQSHTDQRSILARVLDKVSAWLGFGSGVEQLPTGWVNTPYWLGYGALPTAAPPVTEASVLGVPAFGRGVELIAAALAGVELRAYRFDTEQQINVRMEPAPEILREPDPLSTPWHWKYAMVNDLILYGNHFAALGEPNSAGWPRWLQPIDATRVALGRSDEGKLVWKVGDQYLPWGSLFHVSAGNRSGKILGRGVVAQYFDALGGLLATDQHARRYFQAGGTPTGILQSTDPDLTQAQADRIKQRYRETVGAGSREPLVLPATYTFTPVVSDADKQQLVDARRWDAQLAAIVLGIPAYKLGLPGTSMTYQNIEQADIAFVQDSVSRWGDPIQASVTKWLLPAGQMARFDYAGRMRHDAKQRAEIMQAEISAGLLTSDEGRQMLDRPKLPKTPVPPQLQQLTGDEVLNNDPTPEVAA